MRLLVALLAATAAGAACFPVEGERILASDLAAHLPEFSAAPAQTVLGYAPAPGAHRMFHSAELERFAARFGIVAPSAGDLCFERAMEALSPEKIAAAMRAVPDFAQARIEILEFSRFPVPRGEILFPRSSLGAPGSVVFWKGYVRYASTHRFSIWARAKISVTCQRVVAAEALKLGVPIEPRQLRLESYEGLPDRQLWAESVEQVAGRIPRRSFAAGSAISLGMLDAPREVGRGEMVQVSVESGGAHLALMGRAESAGRRGEKISVRNLQSGKTFAAYVEGKGKAVVQAGGEIR